MIQPSILWKISSKVVSITMLTISLFLWQSLQEGSWTWKRSSKQEVGTKEVTKAVDRTIFCKWTPKSEPFFAYTKILLHYKCLQFSHVVLVLQILFLRDRKTAYQKLHVDQFKFHLLTNQAPSHWKDMLGCRTLGSENKNKRNRLWPDQSSHMKLNVSFFTNRLSNK